MGLQLCGIKKNRVSPSGPDIPLTHPAFMWQAV